MTAKEHELLIRVLRAERRSGTHLEIGTAAGGTLCAMLATFPATQRPKFVVVDTMMYFPNQKALVVRNLEQHGVNPGQVEFRVMRSECAFIGAELNRETFDFILIDGSHKVRAVMNDLKWTRLLCVGGVLGVHDYTRRFPGVKLSVDYFLTRNPQYQRIGLSESLLILRKIGVASRPEISRLDELFALALHLPLKLYKKIVGRFREQMPCGAPSLHADQ